MKVELIYNKVQSMEMLLANLWWYFVTVTTLFCVTVGTTWIIQVATEKYRIVYRCNNKQPIKLFEEINEVTDDLPITLLLSKAMKSRPLVRRIKSRPIIIQDPYYVRENRTNRKNGLKGVCSLSAIREEYRPISHFY